ncbi:MAG TPA: DUF4126 family protein [Polyangia bacterium]
MSALVFFVLAFAIGVVAGLRALTAPMVVSWAARFGWIDVQHTWAGFLARGVTPWILTVVAVAELINDQNPKTPSRTKPPSFVFRVVSGAFSGAALAAGSEHAVVVGGMLGAAGAVAGTLGGYTARTQLVKALHVRDLAIALPEDALAVGGGFLIAALFR